MKRAGNLMAGSISDEHRIVGSKRPIRERLGSNANSSAEVNNKRLVSCVPLIFRD